MAAALLNRKQLQGLIKIKADDLMPLVRDLESFSTSDFTSINLVKSTEFENYPMAHRHCYDTFFKGKNEGSLASELYVQYSFTEQFHGKTVDAEILEMSGATVKSRLRRLQPDSPHYIPEADDSRYSELTAECPDSIRQLVEAIKATGDIVSRVRLAGVAPGHSISLHRDHDPSKLIRLHIPIKTNDKCVIDCENKEQEIISVHLEQGGLYMLNTGRRHAAKNESDEWRVHLLVDVCGQNFIKKYDIETIID